VVLSEEDAVAQQSKAGSSIHLSFEEFRFGVDAFGASVVVVEGDRCGDGVDVLVDASGEGECTWGRSASRDAIIDLFGHAPNDIQRLLAEVRRIRTRQT
jgi:hypothetical protein